MKRMQKKIRYGAVIYILALFMAVMFAADLAIPDRQTYLASSASAPVSSITGETGALPGSYTVKAKLFGAIPVKDVSVEILPELSLVPVGDVFGVKFFTKGVIVIGTTEIDTADGFINPAKEAGIQKSDIIRGVNGDEVNTVEELAQAVEKSKGKPLYVEFIREGEEYSCELVPSLSLTDKKYKTGIWVRDSTAGIGTVTYFNPEDGSFAGLGHGICDIDTGELMPLLRAVVVDVEITDIIKGKSGLPGELKGVFDTEKKGSLTGNTSFGVYGTLDSEPDVSYGAIPAAGRDEVTEGDAVILSNVDGCGVKEYKVTLSKIDRRSDGTKCFVVEIVDEKLKELTGGIVQGMSGSPIIQNGKLVGAVTHVLVNEPTKGYGIFIENMLAEAKKAK